MSPASVRIERLGSVDDDDDDDDAFEEERFLFALTFFFGANLPGPLHLGQHGANVCCVLRDGSANGSSATCSCSKNAFSSRPIRTATASRSASVIIPG